MIVSYDDLRLICTLDKLSLGDSLEVGAKVKKLLFYAQQKTFILLKFNIIVFPEKLSHKINERIKSNSLRSLNSSDDLIDFSSNDYLGFAKSSTIFEKTHQFLIDKNVKQNGASGSRLLSGNHFLFNELEIFLAKNHNTESSLIFNSGYDANLGFFSSLPQRGDVILYDEYSHASIRDGIKLANAKAYKFEHNNLDDLEKKILRFAKNDADVYVVTESVFSMDGDSPNLIAMSEIIKKHANTYFVVDEAHALGVFNNGLIEKLNLQNNVFARIVTFGKALGCHGAVILGSKQLTDYLINFARSFIYTTGLSPHAIATIKTSYDSLLNDNEPQEKLYKNIQYFITEVERLNLNFIGSTSSIHCCIIGGNERTKHIANELKKREFDVKPILSPTVPEGKERLRFCLHSYNSTKEITEVLELLATFV